MYYLYMSMGKFADYGYHRHRSRYSWPAKLEVFSLPWRVTGQSGTCWRFTVPALIALLLLHLTMSFASGRSLPWQGLAFFVYATFLAPLLTLIIVERW